MLSTPSGLIYNYSKIWTCNFHDFVKKLRFLSNSCTIVFVFVDENNSPATTYMSNSTSCSATNCGVSLAHVRVAWEILAKLDNNLKSALRSTWCHSKHTHSWWDFEEKSKMNSKRLSWTTNFPIDPMILLRVSQQRKTNASKALLH